MTQDYKSTLKTMAAAQDTLRQATALGKVTELQDALNRATQFQDAFKQMSMNSEVLRTLGHINTMQNITPHHSWLFRNNSHHTPARNLSNQPRSTPSPT